MISRAIAHQYPFSVRRPAVAERTCSRIALASVCNLPCLSAFKVHDHEPVPVLDIRNLLSVRRIHRGTTVDLVVLEKRLLLDKCRIREAYVFLADYLSGIDVPYTLSFGSICKCLSVRRKYHICLSLRSIRDLLHGIVLSGSNKHLSPADERNLLSVC